MKVWRGITLTIWVLLLATTMVIILAYYAFSSTVLDTQSSRQRIAEIGTYGTIRDTVLTDKIVAEIESRYPENTLIDRSMIRGALAEALPDQILKDRADPAVTALYEWLSSRAETPSFSIDVSDVRDDFYKALETQLHRKMTAIDSCGDNRYPPEDALLNDGCLPRYVTSDEATQAIMGNIRATDPSLGNTITEETLFGGALTQPPLKRLPSYLNMFWSLTLLSVAIGLILVIFLLVSRRVVGLVAIGVSLMLAGLSAWVFGGLLRSLHPAALTPELSRSFKVIFTDPTGSTLVLAGLIILGLGIAISGTVISAKMYRKNHG